MNTTQTRSVKRKKSRFFEIYISKILKNISDNGITSNAKQQFNSVLCTIVTIITSKTIELTELVAKKTISEKEINNVLTLLLPFELAEKSIQAGIDAYKTFYSNDELKGVSRQEKSGITFPPSIVEKFLRNFGYSKIMISNNAPIHLTGALEYIASTILTNASLYTKEENTSGSKKHVRITVRDLEMGVRNEENLDAFFNSQHIMFMGGGVVPYIHPSLLIKKSKKKKTVSNPDEKKKHRFI